MFWESFLSLKVYLIVVNETNEMLFYLLIESKNYYSNKFFKQQLISWIFREKTLFILLEECKIDLPLCCITNNN